MTKNNRQPAAATSREGENRLSFRDIADRIMALQTQIAEGEAVINERTGYVCETIEVFAKKSDELFFSSLTLTPKVEATRSQLDELFQSIHSIQRSIADQTALTLQNKTIQEEMYRMLSDLRSGIGKSEELNEHMNSEVSTGKKGVNDAFEAVKKLEAYQVESEKIVKMISEVADRTGIISINTAIEAARAGARGKGFSVIAGEIRKLALMSTGYTNDITTIIRNMNSQVFTVVKAISGVEESLKKILQGVTDTTPLISGISRTMADVMEKDSVLLQKGTELAENVDVVGENARKQQSIAEIYTTTFDSLKEYLNILATTIDTLRDQNEKASTAVDSLKAIQNENTVFNKSIRRIMEQEI